MRIAACRVDWTFLATPDVAEATVAGTGGWVRPLVVASLGIALAVVVAMAVAVPWWRARQRTAVASSEAIVEAKPDEAGLEAVVRRDPAEAARAIDRWVRGGAA